MSTFNLVTCNDMEFYLETHENIDELGFRSGTIFVCENSRLSLESMEIGKIFVLEEYDKYGNTKIFLNKFKENDVFNFKKCKFTNNFLMKNDSLVNFKVVGIVKRIIYLE